MTDLSDIKIKIMRNPDLCWYASVMCALDLELGPSPERTAHTDGLKIVVDPEFHASLSESALTGLILHELRHVTDLHASRIGTRDHKLFNIACDYAIDPDIKAMGFELPFGGHINDKFKDMAAEEIYEILINMPNPPQPKPGSSDLQPGQGDPEKGDGDGSGDGDSAARDKAIQEAVKDIILQATMQAKMQIQRTGRGNIPGAIERMVDEWQNPVLPWQTVLRRYMSAKAKIDHSWRKPSRRYAARGLYMPSLQGETMGPIHVFIDASGSVTDEQFSMQVAQFRWIHKNLKPSEMRIITFDTRIKSVHTFKPTDNINIQFTGRGGTDVGEIVQYMQNNPCLCNLIFTDGYFHKYPLERIQGDVLCLIYDQKGFQWEGTKVIEIDL